LVRRGGGSAERSRSGVTLLADRHSLQATHCRQAARRYAPASLKSGSQLNVGR
jgi:hypothetical protein